MDNQVNNFLIAGKTLAKSKFKSNFNILKILNGE